MRKKIREFIASHRMIRYFYKMIKGIRDDTFVYNVNYLTEGIMSLQTIKKGDKNKGKVIYDLKFSSESGFFAVINSLLNYLYYANSLGLHPYITLDSSFLYYEEDGVDGTFNPWEYYFLQFQNMTRSDIEGSYRVAEFHIKDFKDLDKELGKNGYLYSQKYIDEMAPIMKKYIILNSKVKEKIYEDLNNLVGKKTLGVHIRMGNMLIAPDHHPIVPTLDEYIHEIRTAMKTQQFEQIFLATDDERVVKRVKETFGNGVVYYKDVARVNRTLMSVWDADVQRDKNKYLCGLEVLRDMYTLGECAGLVAGLSQVSLAAQILRKSFQRDYEYIKIINKGINRNKLDPQGKKIKRLMEKGKY